MDRATQQNAAMVEQTSAAARQLSGEIIELSVRAASFEADRRKAAGTAGSAATAEPAPFRLAGGRG